MFMNKKYLIALDLDGTLLKDDKTISSKTKEYLKELEKEGHLIVITSGRALRSVLESILDIKNVINIPRSITPVSIRVDIIDFAGPATAPTKNIVITAIIVGNLPLHGTKLFVSIAISLSLGDSIILHPITPHALHPNPMHMLS